MTLKSRVQSLALSFACLIGCDSERVSRTEVLSLTGDQKYRLAQGVLSNALRVEFVGRQVQFAFPNNGTAEWDASAIAGTLRLCGGDCVIGMLSDQDKRLMESLRMVCADHASDVREQHLIIFVHHRDFEFQDACLSHEIRVVDFDSLVQQAVDAGIVAPPR